VRHGFDQPHGGPCNGSACHRSQTRPMPPSLHTGALELATTVWPRVGADTTGTLLWRTRLTRQARMPCIAQLPPVRSGRDAWGGAHAWARRVREQGHAGKRMAPQFVTPLVTSHQHARRDAEAIAEAVTRPTLRVVRTQDLDQPALHALHRVREWRLGARTALLTAGHGLLHAYGLVSPNGGAQCHHAVVDTLASETDTRTALRPERLGTLVEACVA
jgi:transposase